MSLSPQALAEWSQYIGRTRHLTQILDSENLRRFAVAAGMHADVEKSVPALAHWAYFLPTASDEEIGADGHPKRGGFMPPVTLPRRMFAGAKIVFESPLELKAPARQETRIAALKHKSGRSGDLIFVEVTHVITQQTFVRVREQQTIVYRGTEEDVIEMPKERSEITSKAQWCPGPVNLFRFSAATFNSHRIHYDSMYAKEKEGYPALVVHGPFAAVKLAEFARFNEGRALASFQFRGHAPLFVSQPVLLAKGTDAGAYTAMRCDGVTAMTSTVAHQ